MALTNINVLGSVGAANSLMAGYNPNVDYAVAGVDPMNVPLGMSNAQIYAVNSVINSQTLASASSGGGVQSELAQGYFSGASSYAISYSQLDQRDANYAALVAAAGSNPTSAQATDIANLKAGLANNRQMLVTAFAAADSQIYQIGGYALAVPVAGGSAGIGAAGVAAYEGATGVRFAIGAVTNIATGQATAALEGRGYGVTSSKSAGGNGVLDYVIDGVLGGAGTFIPDKSIFAKPIISLPGSAALSSTFGQVSNGEVPNSRDVSRDAATLGIFHF